MQINTMPVTLTTFNGENRLDSRLIADLLGVKRKEVYWMVRHYQADLQRFGIIRFETGAIQGRQGPEKCALLNQEQVARLLTYFDSSPATQAAAARLLQAFDPAMPDFAKRTPDPVSTTALVPFSFDSREIRFIPKEDSFSVVAKDVLQALGFSESSLANIPDRISHVPDDWKGRHPIATLGGEQEIPTTALVPFSFESREIRVVMQEHVAWWIAMDVASVLDYSDTEAMTRRLDDDEIQNLQIVGFGPRGVTIINESGLYSAILGSRKPEAKKFKKWVTSEVLPSIRRTGTYTLPGAVPPAVERPLTAALRTTINRHAWRLAQESFETYRTAMLEAARFDPAFKPEQWNPVECLPMPQPATLDPPDMADMARQLAMESRYRSRNPQRDYEVLQLRLDGMNYREIGLEVGISGTHAWRIVNRQMGMAGAL